jgi:hypothetical protein
MKDIIRKALHEEIQRRYRRVTPELMDKLRRYLSILLKGVKITTFGAEHTYGDIRTQFCKNNQFIMTVIFNVKEDDDDEDYYDYASLHISGSILSQILSTFKIKEKFALEIITEYVEDNYVEDISREYGLNIYDIDSSDVIDVSKCRQKVMDNPPELSKEDMIEWLVINQTTFRRPEMERWNEKEVRYWYRRDWIRNKANELGYDY